MKPVEIALYETSVSRVSVPVDAYCYRPKHGWRLLQRVCIWVLRRLNCHYYQEELAGVRRIRIDVPDLAERFVRADREIWRRSGRRPEMVYMGAEDFEKLAGESDLITSPFQFPTIAGFDGSFFGVPVKVIPWMSGILVV